LHTFRGLLFNFSDYFFDELDLFDWRTNRLHKKKQVALEGLEISLLP